MPLCAVHRKCVTYVMCAVNLTEVVIPIIVKEHINKDNSQESMRCLRKVREEENTIPLVHAVQVGK